MQRWSVIVVTFVTAYSIASIQRIVSPPVVLVQTPQLATQVSAAFVAPRVSVAILTQSANHKTRLAAVLDSWARDVNVEIIATDNAANEVSQKHRSKMLVCPFRGSESLGSKALYVWQNLCGKPQADFYVMTDDDTLLNVPVLEEALSFFSPMQDLYAGYVCTHLRVGPFVGGGAGIVLSRRTLQRLCEANVHQVAKCRWDKTNQSAGDLATQDCLVRGVGVRPTHIDGFIPFTTQAYGTDSAICDAAWWLPAHMNCSNPPEQIIGMHYVQPSQMQPWYFLMTHIRKRPSQLVPPKVLREFAPQDPAHRKREEEYYEMLRQVEETKRKTKEHMARKAREALLPPAIVPSILTDATHATDLLPTVEPPGV